MKNCPIILILFFLFTTSLTNGNAESNSKEYRHPLIQAGIELGGAGLAYSAFGSIRPISNCAINLGITFWGAESILLPGSFSFLHGDSEHLLELLGGGALTLKNEVSALGDKFTNIILSLK